jgi:hypothetical protein
VGYSYAELSAVPRAFVRPPKRFLSHAWERPFHELVEHLMATERAAAVREVGSGVGEDEWLQMSVWIGACSSSHWLVRVRVRVAQLKALRSAQAAAETLRIMRSVV